MTIELKDYDFPRALRSLRDRLDLAGGYTPHDYWTQLVRDQNDAASALASVAYASQQAVGSIREELTSWTFDGGAPWPAEHPLTRTVRRARAHPSWQPLPAQAAKTIVGIDELHAAAPLPWDPEAARAELIAWLVEQEGDLLVEADTPIEVLAGRLSPLRGFLQVIVELLVLEAFGAFDPGFTRRHALRGDWWLLQLASPRLDVDAIALQLGLRAVGFLPPNHVDVPGRVVIACYERQRRSVEDRAWIIDDCKYVAGYQHVRWTIDAPPLSDPSFDLVPRLQPMPRDGNDYGPYRHPATLPRWPVPRAR